MIITFVHEIMIVKDLNNCDNCDIMHENYDC